MPLPSFRTTDSAARLPLLAAVLALTACASPTPPAAPEPATCPSVAEVRERARLYVALEMLPAAPAGLTREGAACGAAKFIAALVPTHGDVVGYKAGLTNPAVQQRFGLTAPLRGTLLRKMLLEDGAEVPARFGARPFMEPDLMVEVGSSAIHDAKTPEQVLAHLRAVVPFMELADALAVDPSKIDAPTLVLNNVGARLGVLGKRVPVRNDTAFADALRDMTVRTSDGSGKELAAAKGTAILGHPLNAVIWLAAELKKDGITLKPGDLLSLGAFGQGPVAAGQSLTVRYDGLPGNPQVSVRFK
ncbi:MAG: fumarylacetoacetate hydrolase [Rubrivivax sp.]|jgi:2-keto-4-pentenoate hydratase|nr:fumarylacetoacetate hydrolase [Rubrivivax sp.]